MLLKLIFLLISLGCFTNVSLAKDQIFKNSNGYEITLPSCWKISVDGPNDGTEDITKEDALYFSAKSCLESKIKGFGVEIYSEKLNRSLIESNFKKRIAAEKGSKRFVYFSEFPSKDYITYSVEKYSDEKNPLFRWQVLHYCSKKRIDVVGGFISEETQTDEAVLKKINQKNFDIPKEILNILNTIKCNS
ncbi:MAG: hypothetical protein WA160_02230 [Pseudobdellovibrio sp.]